MKNGMTIVGYPQKEKLFDHSCEPDFCTCSLKTPATDIINSMKSKHSNMVAKLVDSSVHRFDDKLEIIKSLIGMGLSSDV